MEIMRDLVGLSQLEKLLLWFNAAEREGEIGFEGEKKELFERIGKTVGALENLRNVCLMFGLPGFGDRDIQELRRKLKEENMKLNVKIY